MASKLREPPEMKDVKVALEEERSNLAAVKSEGEKAALNFKILSGNERAGFRVATKAEIQPAGDRLGNGTWRGSIGGEFNGYRLPFLRKLSVRVIEARGMPKMDTFETSSNDLIQCAAVWESLPASATASRASSVGSVGHVSNASTERAGAKMALRAPLGHLATMASQKSHVLHSHKIDKKDLDVEGI